MCKRLMFLISFVFVLGLVSSAFAETYEYTGDYPWSVLWISPWNWEPVAPYGGPTGCDDEVEIPAVGPMVIDTVVTIGGIRGPAYDGGADADMYLIKDCNLYVCDQWEVRDTDPYTGTTWIADDAIVSVGSLRVHGDDGRAVINMSDSAQLLCRKDLRFGDQDNDYFELNMTDSAYLFVADEDDRMYMERGEFHIDLSGSAIAEVARIRARTRTEEVTCTITVRESAQLICTDDYLRLAGGDSDVTVNVLDDAIVDVDGDFYFGEDNDFTAQGVLNMSGQLITMSGGFGFIDDDEASGFTTVNLTSGLINTEDELWSETDNWVVNICGDGVWVVDGDIVDEVRQQEAEGHWFACPGLNCRGEFGSTYDLMVEYDTLEYPGKTKIWADKNLEKAWAPSPEDGATGVSSLGVDLCWCPGESAEVHHVFFSDDEAAVETRDMAIYMGPLHGHDNTCYPSGPLMLGQTYYWAVDEQDAGITIVEGDVWEFTVEECRAIEDMEAYTRNPSLIYETWYDGCGYWVGEQLISNGTGSCVDLAIDKLHGGAKAMVYTYENVYQSLWERDHNYSEARREFDPALDLTASGEAALIVWFHGNRDNDVTNMWVLLNDGAAATYGDNGDDPADITKEEWIDWNIDLAGFTGLSAVSSLSIGFGDKVGNVPDDALGIMWFDDIQVCPVRCVPKYTPDIFDLNGDCITDWKDVAMQAGDNWLEDNR